MCHYYGGAYSVGSSALLGGLLPLPKGLFPLGPLLYSGASSSNFLSAFLNVAGITSSTMPININNHYYPIYLWHILHLQLSGNSNNIAMRRLNQLIFYL